MTCVIKKNLIPGYALRGKRFTKTNRRRSTGQQPGTKSARGPAAKPRVKRGLCSSTGLHRISFVRGCEETFRTVVYDTMGGWQDRRLLGRSNRRHAVLPGPAPPRRPAMRRADPPEVCPGFGLDRFLQMFASGRFATKTTSFGFCHLLFSL